MSPEGTDTLIGNGVYRVRTPVSLLSTSTYISYLQYVSIFSFPPYFPRYASQIRVVCCAVLCACVCVWGECFRYIEYHNLWVFCSLPPTGGIFKINILGRCETFFGMYVWS